MEIQQWKDSIIKSASLRILHKSNMDSENSKELQVILLDYLKSGINILKKWCKIRYEQIFVGGDYDSSLIDFLVDKYATNGIEVFGEYSSGNSSLTQTKSAESILKSKHKQVM